MEGVEEEERSLLTHFGQRYRFKPSRTGQRKDGAKCRFRPVLGTPESRVVGNGANLCRWFVPRLASQVD